MADERFGATYDFESGAAYWLTRQWIEKNPEFSVKRRDRVVVDFKRRTSKGNNADIHIGVGTMGIYSSSLEEVDEIANRIRESGYDFTETRRGSSDELFKQVVEEALSDPLSELTMKD